MSTSENRSSGVGFGRSFIVYLIISVFCAVIFFIYDHFSHGVRSLYMTWLFVWPLVLGVLPCAFFAKCKKVRSPGRIGFNIWNSGVAALTVSSLLRGVFEIAGTASPLQEWLMRAGFAILAAGAVVCFAGK